MGAWTTVEYVAQDMQRIDGKPLYQLHMATIKSSARCVSMIVLIITLMYACLLGSMLLS